MCKLSIQISTLLWDCFKDNEYVFSPPPLKLVYCKRNTVIQMCCLYAVTDISVVKRRGKR